MSLQCCKPIEIFWNVKTNKHQFKFDQNCTLKPIYVDCNKCESCQQKYISQLGMRSRHELLYCNSSCFITLTVANEFIDEVFPNNSLDHLAFQKFIRRLRDYLRRTKYKNNPEDCPKIKYIMCGEYGEKFLRPHYHAVIFGYDFDDIQPLYQRGKQVKGTFRSSELEKLWTYGFSSVKKANYDTCTYLAKYVAKGKGKTKDEYQYLDTSTGEIKYRKKEYMVYPKGGLGKQFFMDNHKVILRQGYFNLPMKKKQQGDGRIPAKIGIPRYYKKLAEKYYGKEYKEYQDRLAPIIEEKNSEYIYNKILKPKKDLSKVLLMAELTGMDKPQIVQLLNKEFTESEVYYNKIREGESRARVIRARNEAFGN